MRVKREYGVRYVRCAHINLWLFIELCSDHARSINYYGDRNARLYRTQIPDEEGSPSIFMKLLFLLLFDAPSTYLINLRDLYVNQVLYAEGWRKYIESLCNNWHDMILWVCSSFYFTKLTNSWAARPRCYSLVWTFEIHKGFT